MVKAAIFDMDGVLVDSEPLYETCISEVMRRRGITLPDNFARDFFGIPSLRTFEYLVETYHPAESVEELLGEEIAIMRERFARGEVPAVPHAFALMKALKAAGYRIGISTSNYLENVQSTLANNGALADVECISSLETTVAFKPAPEVFLRTARLLEVPPSYCVVFEDSTAGVRGANAAGMRVVAYSPPDRVRADLRLAHRVIEGFDRISVPEIDALLSGDVAAFDKPSHPVV